MEASHAPVRNSYTKLATLTLIAALSAAAIVLMVVLSGCTKTTDLPPAQDPGSIVADLKVCAEAPVHDLALDSLDDFATALVSANYAGAIASVVTGIAKQVYSSLKGRAEEAAWQTAKCAITELQGQATKHLGYRNMDAATVQRESLMRNNASAWLQAH